MASERPFYHEFACAYDLLIDRPVACDCRGIVETLARRNVLPGARILDAGCGTGRYARELASLGYAVEGIDSSCEMIAEARRSAGCSSSSVSFTVGNLLSLPRTFEYDAVLCRGVLNDLLDLEDRERAFESLAGALRPDGVLLFDVREWRASVDRKTREPVYERTVETPRGTLRFRSATRLDPENHQLLLTEHHSLVTKDGEATADFEFVMKCWTRDEIEDHLRRAGFRSVEIASGYTPSPPAGALDHLVVTASR